MHPRAELRNTVQELLIDAATIAGERVFKTRTRPVRDDAIPCILIFTTDEQADEENSADQSYKEGIIRVILKLQLWINTTTEESNTDDDLDEFCGVVKGILKQERSWPSTLFSPVYQSTNTRQEEADKRLLWALMTFRFSYLD